MCYAAVIPYVAAAVVAVAGVQEVRVQRAAGETNAKISENNARLAEQQGKDEAILNAREQQQAAWRTRALIGSQRASLAANMIDPTSGTAFDLVGESALFGGADQSALSQEGARRAWGFTAQALNARNEGTQAKWLGKQQSRITILRTIGSVASMGASGAFSGTGSNMNSMTYSSGSPYKAGSFPTKSFTKA